MYNVDGFLFEDEATAELAKKEEDGIRFIKERTALDNPEVVYKLFKKLLAEQLFVTPVGIRFLMELQNSLLACELIPKEEIPGIPVAPIVLKADGEAVQAEEKVEADAVVESDADAEKKNVNDKLSAKKEKKKKSTQKKVQRVDDGYKKPFYVALFFAIVFACSVAGMFMITEISGNNVNILNYREEILDEYSTWESQLKEKEAELAEWEAELESRE